MNGFGAEWLPLVAFGGILLALLVFNHLLMFYDNLTSHRVAAGIKIAELARLSVVGETTIRRIEKHEASAEETLTKIINALNDTKFYIKNPIDPKKEIKNKSKFGTQLKVVA